MTKISSKDASIRNLELCKIAPVIPVLIIEDISSARGLGEALVAGGLPVLEVTLRTQCALQAISEMSKIKGGIVGAGTLITYNDVKNAVDAGATFGVSPGATDNLIDACEEAGLPLLAGASSASEAMALLEKGYSVQKFFPAEAAGGAAFLKSLSSPLPQITFCPTGGISQKNALNYLASSNVECVGGSWVAPKEAIANRDWQQIEDLAKDAVRELS
ncbi:bifunctional 4-hydroxy-2-oxoglutarate aldolase/2-dehydro-3-deoxy-phosphogluconate aldolase [Amylibacter sp.]|jgi:2-dehydro-3-deoxyphosphogluconate aldolase/(4S)-4-hydroxy-2-oxoglutarate aldolase|nr:bifunctional 4-hydroxy-2-oxoglutarate aldolase/2-dehydro-3-deoxy-phosphogluconate aldolase [Rhodobacterales bacterium]MDA9779456.1 bifunctional 4-hydroxy-2-oxoglutarate aldolase/2-dehydro-3-deoxy-phosphogluconate aldolase [Amylibacter sp.]MBT4470339.1 bifunctional 4-hydroxy-2-oxoglutarate aldolase/2-dehydro-3-deoxy-phosphogluconate aldolase [Rhodobacterales bacterium]MBT6009448.1 bifunctional 4-hydroxy-2-oxoglutarate aldolase/2-dehydro-3-deoxy-phosphogluconate aldolase [Rhodobacterales bacter|tara:strand:+ start:558 stop:1208 length:651 start_codon:yes stop_codon:yes gene_type:complete